MINFETTNLLTKNHKYYSKINSEDEEYSPEECSICFEEISNNDLKTLKCGHYFHKNCIDSWLKINPICPYCREYTKNYFECYLKTKYFQKKCRIYVDEEKFSKIVIDVYTAFIDTPTKQYIIPTTFIKSVENINNFCFLYFKETNKEEPLKYSFKFTNKNSASNFSLKITKIFSKYFEFYKSSILGQ
tara:strand:- start:1635 stop:2198 length:564 start_codon:yes stop_codon:yes gene_type:complete